MLNKRIMLTLLSAVMFLKATAVCAKSTDILVQGKDCKYYQYNIDLVVDSFINNKVLYNDLLNRGTVKAYYDEKIKAYVDVDKIIDEFVKNSKEFDLNTFTENAQTSDLVQVDDTIQTIIVDKQNGNIEFGEIINFDENLDVTDIY